MRNKSIVLVLALLLAAAGLAFGAAESEEDAADGYVVGLSNFSVENSWRVQMVAEAEYAASQMDEVARLIVTNSEGSAEKQVSDIEDLIAQGVDAILITAANPRALVPAVARAMAEGIVVVDFDNLVDTENITSHIVVDQKEFGRVQGDWLVEQLDGQGQIVAFNGIDGTQISADRFEGAKNVFDQYPGIEIVQTVFAAWDYAQAKRAMESILAANPNIDGVWSQGGAMSEAVVETYLERDLMPPPVTGEDGNGFLKIWKQVSEQYPEWSSIATSMPTWVSAQALRIAVQALDGESVPSVYEIPIPTITQETLNDYVKPNLPDSYWTNSDLPESIVADLFER